VWTKGRAERHDGANSGLSQILRKKKKIGTEQKSKRLSICSTFITDTTLFEEEQIILPKYEDYLHLLVLLNKSYLCSFHHGDKY
jgi:hypothetical protein